MKATYNAAVRYTVEATCASPLRTGPSDGDTETVLNTADGQAFIQGTSVAGAIKSYLSECGTSAAVVGRLFGCLNTASHLIVSDAMIENGEKAIRPRIHIDRKTGSVAKNKKTGSAEEGDIFHIAHVSPDASLRFELVWLGEAVNGEELDAVEKALSAMNSGVLPLGGQRSNGFGRLSGLKVNKARYNLTDEKDRAAWLNGDNKGEALKLDTVSAQATTFVIKGRAENILVKSGTRRREGGRDITEHIKEKGTPIIPASSVKGAVRSRTEYIANVLGVDNAAVELFGRGATDGDNGKCGEVVFHDAYLQKNSAVISRIRIDKFTGGVMTGGLFTEEPLASEVEIKIETTVTNETCLALLTYALRDLGLGLYNLGSGGSIGRGFVSVSTLEISTPEGEKAVLAFKDGQAGVTEGASLLSEWSKAIGGVDNGK